jgi:hypothetical protein
MSLISKAIDGVFGVVGKLVKDKDLAQTLNHEINKTILNSGLAQMEVNKVEAAHRSIFVAGWRPFIGWVCGTALLYHYIVRDWIVWAFSVWAADLPIPPTMDMSSLNTILMGMLGLGGLRTYEKLKGVSK